MTARSPTDIDRELSRRVRVRRLAAERHPDRGGSDAMMADLNRARDEARKARGTP